MGVGPRGTGLERMVRGENSDEGSGRGCNTQGRLNLGVLFPKLRNIPFEIT